MTQIALQHQSGMYPMSSGLDLLTTAEAARLLKVSTVTIQRWIKQGRLTAYHVGPRKIRIHRSDLTDVITLKTPMSTSLPTRPLTDEGVARGLAALKGSEALIQRILKRRHGKPLSPSWPLIREEREERSKRI